MQNLIQDKDRLPLVLMGIICIEIHNFEIRLITRFGTIFIENATQKQMEYELDLLTSLMMENDLGHIVIHKCTERGTYESKHINGKKYTPYVM